MTFKEKWQQDHPGVSFNPVVRCPSFFGYEPADINCAKPKRVPDMLRVCGECWNREMPSLKAATQVFGNHSVDIPYTGHTQVEYVDTAEFANAVPSILDSGELTTFETGAVRSDFNADGTRKGRCDLLPLRVLARIWRAFDTSMQEREVDKARVFDHIADFQDTGNAQHLVLALNSFTGYLDFPTSFLEVAKHYEEGAEKYGECNWQKGLPIHNYVSSMVRHYLKWLRGDTDEPHDRAFVWNVLCCIWECEFSPRATSGSDQDAPVMVLEHVTKANSVSVAYLCDRAACPVCDNPQCLYTEDVSHAVNFEAVQNSGASGVVRYVERQHHDP